MRRIVLSIALLGAAAPVVAAVENVTSGEMALLPPYCPDTQTFKYGNASFNPSPRAGYWIGLMGPTFWHMHHYCWALINVRRGQLPGVAPQFRRGHYESALGDYNYVVKNAPPDFVLLPEIFTRIGEANVALGNMAGAYDAFMKARSIKRDYWPPYLRWAEVLATSNQKSEARQVLAEGLKYSPNAKPLLDKYRQLGGDASAIRPVTVKSSARSPDTSSAAESPDTGASGAIP